MKNQYVGDIGDFYKFGLLRFIFKSANEQLGVNWYLTGPDSKTHGNLTDFGNILPVCDPTLNQLLKTVRHPNRSVSEIEQIGILPRKTVFFRKEIPGGFDARNQWHQQALTRLKDCSLVFLDPDNSVQSPKVEYGTTTGQKYAFRDEIEDYYRQGKTIIVYSQRSREKEPEYLHRFTPLTRDLNCEIRGYRAKTNPIRDFFFIIHPKHDVFINERVWSLLNDKHWGNQFKELNPSC